MGFSKICCLDKIINCTRIHVNDTEGDDSYNDITDFEKAKYENNRLKNINEESWGFIPRKRGNIEFNQEMYCKEIDDIIFKTNLSTISKETISTFSKIYPKQIPEWQINQL